MSCARYTSLLRDLALGASATADLQVHLASCPACREALEGARRLAGRIDREIERGLTVAPSADFLARVRARVAEEPGPRRPSAPRWLVPVAVGLGALALVAHLSRRAPVERPAPVPRAASRSPGATPEAARESPPAPAPAAREARATAGAGQAGTARRAEPVILVPPAERAAFERFVAGRDRWRMEPESPAEAAAAAPQLAALALAPIEIELLTLD